MAVVTRQRKTAAVPSVKKAGTPVVKKEAKKKQQQPAVKKDSIPAIKREDGLDPLTTQRVLQKAFTITPKTARLLMQSGIHDYSDLQHVSTNEILARFGKCPGMTPADAKNYRAAMRRLVYVATLPDPETFPKRCSEWSMKGLIARGAWREDFDDLTGVETKGLLE